MPMGNIKDPELHRYSTVLGNVLHPRLAWITDPRERNAFTNPSHVKVLRCGDFVKARDESRYGSTDLTTAC
jgi:hypothetical protein